MFRVLVDLETKRLQDPGTALSLKRVLFFVSKSGFLAAEYASWVQNDEDEGIFTCDRQ